LDSDLEELANQLKESVADSFLWIYSGYRKEWYCPHGVGHGKDIHGCDGCCSRHDFPGKG